MMFRVLEILFVLIFHFSVCRCVDTSISSTLSSALQIQKDSEGQQKNTTQQQRIISGSEESKSNGDTSSAISYLCSALQGDFDEEASEVSAGMKYDCTCGGNSIFSNMSIDCDSKGCIGDGTCGNYSVGLHVRSEDPNPPSSKMYSCFDSYDGTYEYCIEARMCSIFEIATETLCECTVHVNGEECNSCTICDNDGFDIDCTNINIEAGTNGCHKEGIAVVPFLLAGQKKGDEAIEGCIYNPGLTKMMCDGVEKHSEEQLGGDMTCQCTGCLNFESECISDEPVCIGDHSNCGVATLDYSRSLFAKSTCSSINEHEFCISIDSCSSEGLCCTATANSELCNSCQICGTNSFSVDCTNINSQFTTDGCIEGSNVKGISDTVPPELVSLFYRNYNEESRASSEISTGINIHTNGAKADNLQINNEIAVSLADNTNFLSGKGIEQVHSPTDTGMLYNTNGDTIQEIDDNSASTTWKFCMKLLLLLFALASAASFL